jgi:hypothetical protein
MISLLANDALHRTAIPLRSIAAGELWRWGRAKRKETKKFRRQSQDVTTSTQATAWQV